MSSGMPTDCTREVVRVTRSWSSNCPSKLAYVMLMLGTNEMVPGMMLSTSTAPSPVLVVWYQMGTPLPSSAMPYPPSPGACMTSPSM